jgi:hypothetical protein
MRTSVSGLLMIFAVSQARAQDSLPPQTLTVPAGARLLAQMQRQLHTWSAKPGDTVYLQTTFPLTSNDTILIPAGSRGERGGATGALIIGLTAPAAGAAIGAASGSDAKSAGIGSAIGSVIGLTALVFGAAHGTDVVMDAGLPMEVELQGPLTLDARRAAVPAPASTYVQVRSRRAGRGAAECLDPGTPGTPDIVIPGTPPAGDFPGTADVVIPGQPATPSFWYRC